MNQRSTSVTLFFFCLWALQSTTLAEIVFDRNAAVGGINVDTATGRFVPPAEIGLPDPGVPVRYDAPAAQASSGTGVVRLMPIGDSIFSGAKIFNDGVDRARESLRPFLWRDIHVDGPDLIKNGAVAMDFVGEFSDTGRPFWGDDTDTGGVDNLTGINPVLDNTHTPFMGPGNSFGIPPFDDGNQAGRGLDAQNFINCGPGHPVTTDCSVSMGGVNGFDQTDVPSQGNAAKWIADHVPDIVAIMLGTNNILNVENDGQQFTSNTANGVTFRIEQILDEIELANPDACIFISQVPSMWTEEAPNTWVPRFDDDDGVEGPHNEVVAMNDALVTMIAGLPAGYDVTLVNIDPLDPRWDPSAVDTWMEPDEGGVHPSTLGDEHIARQFFLAMEGALEAKAAAAVPEPSSFAFLGLLCAAALGQQFVSRRRARAFLDFGLAALGQSHPR